MAIICITVLIFPHQLAAITNPSDAAMVLKPETANSLAIITIAAHAGTNCNSTKDISAAVTSSLSAKGSINLPKLVT